MQHPRWYRKRATTDFVAIRWTGDNTGAVRDFLDGSVVVEVYTPNVTGGRGLFVGLYSPTVILPRDWLIREPGGRVLVCSSDAFDAEYEPSPPSPSP